MGNLQDDLALSGDEDDIDDEDQDFGMSTALFDSAAAFYFQLCN